MFVRSTHLNHVLSVLFVVGIGACSGSTGCCSFADLPGGKLPADQTVEGGGQIRVTQSGFAKITAVLPGYLNQSLGNGFCVGTGNVGTPSGGFLATGAQYCGTNQAGTPAIPDACGASNGCNVGVHLDSVNLQVVNDQALNLKIQLDVDAVVPLSGQVVGIGFSCGLTASGQNIAIDADITFGIDPPTGKLTLQLAGINGLDTSDLTFSGCSVVSDVANLLNSLLNSFIGGFITDLLTPTFNTLIQSLLPDPLGVEGLVDLGAMLQGVSPGTEATMEARVIPGGYVALNGGGLNLGIITGINADEDTATRTPDLDSEPARCVPPIPAPNFGAPPANLPISGRSTFQLLASDQLSGNPDPANTDVAIGISETTLDLAGHHLVTSGAMCLGVGTALINQLNVGTFGFLVPSLAELGNPDGKDPLLLVTRPQQALDFEIGENTDASPAINIHVNHVEVDLYAFLYERYTRALTLDLSMTIGLKLTFDQVMGKTVLRANLVGIDSQSVTVKVMNSQFVREAPADLEAVLPAVFDLVAGSLTSIPDITVPDFAGFKLANLRVQHVTTQQDDFVALFGNLEPSAMMRTIALKQPLMADAVAMMDEKIAKSGPVSTAVPKLLSVDTPDVETIRGAFRKSAAGRLPQITFEAPSHDSLGRDLEWSYRLNGGMWRSYRKPMMEKLVISEQMFALQGKYHIELESRVVDDYHTGSAITAQDVVIDSVAPRLIEDKMAWTTDGNLEIPVYDVTAEHDVQYGFAAPGADAPVAWHDGAIATISRVDATKLAINGELVVFVKDPNDNVAQYLVAPFHGAPGEAGCSSCDVHGGPGAGGLMLIIVVGGVLFTGRRRTKIVSLLRRRGAPELLTVAAIVVGSAFVPACSCGKEAEAVCEVNDDCDAYCPFGQEGVCMNNQCSCELTAGRTGPYSDVAASFDGTVWVSAYSQTFGDLVVAQVTDPGRIPDETWQWVDGVPDEPPTIKDSHIRGGITTPGPDVGMYTSIAVSSTGVPMVSYWDRDNASLMFAMKVGDTWQKHVVDAGGTGIEGEGIKVGMYTSLTLRADNDHPGIAYLAHVTDTTGAEVAEVRYASAQTATPGSAADWTTYTVDSAPVIVDPANPEIYPLPGGLGLFIDSARQPNGAPVVVYYDRANGELKMSKVVNDEFTTPVVLDGSTGDAGWSPSVAVDADGIIRVAYVSATNDDFKYITDEANAKAETIDTGYRIVGQSIDGLPKPEYHFVGDDAGLVMPGNGASPLVVYQDATTQELLLGTRGADGIWTHISLAGHTDPWPGGYGFFAADAIQGSDIVISSWVIDQPHDENWVEIFKRPAFVQ